MPARLIRSVFDQYSQVENRLTHALVQVLARDPRLAREFVRFSTGIPVAARPPLSFACQAMPGETPRLVGDEPRGERIGIPDAWIYRDDPRWALLIESKVTAPLDPAQLRRHLETAQSRGFKDVRLLAITADEGEPTWLKSVSVGRVYWMGWPRIYEFLATGAVFSNPVARFLAKELLDFLRAVEARLMAEQTVLTTFTGIPFGADHPYNEPEARVVLRALMQKLRPRLASSEVLPVSSDFEQKPLTGTWDVIGFRSAAPGEAFTNHPHLTLSLWYGASIELTIPNGAKGEYWRRLRGADSGVLDAVFSEVVERMRPLRRALGRGLTEPRLAFEITQRHFHARRQEIVDGRLEFDLDALYAQEGSVKPLPAWLEAARAVLADSGRANVQVGLQARYPFSERSVSRTPEFVDALVTAAEAFHPFLAFLQGTH